MRMLGSGANESEFSYNSVDEVILLSHCENTKDVTLSCLRNKDKLAIHTHSLGFDEQIWL